LTAETLLFPESEQTTAERIDSNLLMLLTGNAGGPLGMTLSSDEKTVLHMLRYRRGLKNALSIRDLQQKTRLVPRSIKDIVRGLRMNFALPIGSSKSSLGGGYYIMITREDVSAWGNDLFSQVKAEVAAFRAAAGAQATAELVGQLSLEVRK
jgi:1,4-dihydroxy-2-naphthoyl-CoA synthase